jgi:hypothetical protein
MQPKGEKNCKMYGILSKAHGVQYPLGTGGKVEFTLKEAHHQFTIRTAWNFEPRGLNSLLPNQTKPNKGDKMCDRVAKSSLQKPCDPSSLAPS